MKVVRFLKRVGIVAIPILAVVILLLCFNSISILSFNAVHPDKLSRDLFANNMFNTYWILISIGTSLGVFFKLRNWKKAKIRKMMQRIPKLMSTRKAMRVNMLTMSDSNLHSKLHTRYKIGTTSADI